VTLSRKAVKDFTFSDGTFIPKGTLIAAPTLSLHHDKNFYENPDVFEPFRFAHMCKEDRMGSKHQFTSTSVEYLPFGLGKNAWCDLASFMLYQDSLIILLALDVSSLQAS
jgi:cytochrome P450